MQHLIRRIPSRTVLVAVIVSLLVGGIGSATAAKLITGKQIKNGSIQYKDLSKKARKKLRGKRGKKGSQGAQGVQGAKGDPGPSAAFSAFHDTISPPPLPANADTTVVTLAVPAGKYVINAKTDMDEISGAKHVETCHLRAGADSDRIFVTTDGTANGEESCALQVVHEFTAPGNVTLSIETSAGTQVRGGDAKVTAIQVGALTNTAVTG